MSTSPPVLRTPTVSGLYFARPSYPTSPAPVSLEFHKADPVRALAFFKRLKNIREFDRFILRPTHPERPEPLWNKLLLENCAIVYKLLDVDANRRFVAMRSLFADMELAFFDIAYFCHEYIELQLFQKLRITSDTTMKRIRELFSDSETIDFDGLVQITGQLIKISNIIEKGRNIPPGLTAEKKKFQSKLNNLKNEFKKDYLRKKVPQLLALAKESNLEHIKQEYKSNIIKTLDDDCKMNEITIVQPEQRMMIVRSIIVAGEILKCVPDRFKIETKQGSVNECARLRDQLTHTISKRIDSMIFGSDCDELFVEIGSFLRQLYAYIFEEKDEPCKAKLVEFGIFLKSRITSGRPRDDMRDLEIIVKEIISRTNSSAGFILWDCVTSALHEKYAIMAPLSGALKKVPKLIMNDIKHAAQHDGARSSDCVTNRLIINQFNQVNTSKSFLKLFHHFNILESPKNHFFTAEFPCLQHELTSFWKRRNLQEIRNEMILEYISGGNPIDYLVSKFETIFENVHKRNQKELQKLENQLPVVVDEYLNMLSQQSYAVLAKDRAIILARMAAFVTNPVTYPNIVTNPDSGRMDVLKCHSVRVLIDPFTQKISCVVRFLAFILVSILSGSARETSKQKGESNITFEFDSAILRKLRNFWAHPGSKFPHIESASGVKVGEAEALTSLVYLTQFHLDIAQVPLLANLLNGSDVDDVDITSDNDNILIRSASLPSLNM